MRVLRRDTHTMSLTEAGHRLLSDAKAMLLLAEVRTAHAPRAADLARAHPHLRDNRFRAKRRQPPVASLIQDNPAVTVRRVRRC